MTPNLARSLLRLAVIALALAVTGCVKKLYVPPKCDRPDASGCIIEGVGVTGNRAAGDGDIKEKIATAETDHPFAGVFEKVPVLSIIDQLLVTYERFDPFVLERDLARVERYYRSIGHYEAHARAGRVIPRKDGTVQVEIVVDEGEAVKIKGVAIEWKDAPKGSETVQETAKRRANNLLKKGNRFEEEPFEEVKKRVLRVATNAGYAYATVEGKADVDLVKREASIKLVVELGPLCKFGPVKIEGLGNLPEKPLRAIMKVKEGQKFSTERLEEDQVKLGNFGVFGSVDVTPQLAPEGKTKDPVVPIVFQVQPSALRTIKLGGGAELGSRVELHGIASWENRNFLGGLRHFLVEARPGGVIYPLTVNTLFSDPADTIRFLPELRVRAELTQPVFIEGNTKGLLSGAINAYRLITSGQNQAQNCVVGYVEFAGRAGVERQMWETRGGRVTLGLYGNVQHDLPFCYHARSQLNVPLPGDRPDLTIPYRPTVESLGYTQLTIPYLQTIFTLDLREGRGGKLDPLNPRQGFYLSLDAQVAGYPFGAVNSATITSDVRLRPEIRFYIPLARRWTLAGRFLTGFLFPGNYGSALLETAPGACGALDITSPAAQRCGRDLQLLQFRGFFSGGPNSNRGYPYNGVGPHEIIPTLSNMQVAGNAALPTGGLTVWEGSLEVRARIVDKFGATIFVDASNVGRNLRGFLETFLDPHMSAGLGFRYETPVGPLRADLGVRIPCMQVRSAGRPCRAVNDPGSAPPEGNDDFLPAQYGQAGSVFGIPLAVSIAIGEAF